MDNKLTFLTFQAGNLTLRTLGLAGATVLSAELLGKVELEVDDSNTQPYSVFTIIFCFPVSTAPIFRRVPPAGSEQQTQFNRTRSSGSTSTSWWPRRPLIQTTQSLPSLMKLFRPTSRSVTSYLCFPGSKVTACTKLNIPGQRGRQ